MCKLNKLPIDLAGVKKILQQKNISTQYQPIVSLADDSTLAYEALARFELYGESLPPDLVFDVCHQDLALFFELEMSVKKHQFQNRPENKKLFINFDPHILHYRQRTKEIFTLMSKQSDFVIELVENSHESINIERLIEVFNKLKYQFAVDDFFKENSIISLYLLKKCHYLKLDKDILKQIKKDRAFIEVVKGICNYAHKIAKEVVLEGIETKEDLCLAYECEVDFVQGFYFKDRFIDKNGLSETKF